MLCSRYLTPRICEDDRRLLKEKCSRFVVNAYEKRMLPVYISSQLLDDALNLLGPFSKPSVGNPPSNETLQEQLKDRIHLLRIQSWSGNPATLNGKLRLELPVYRVIFAP